MLDRVIDALVVIELVRKGADGTFSLVGPEMQLGYLEQLWRVFVGLSAECYRRRVASIPYGQLAPLLSRRGLGQGTDQRSAGRISTAIRYAQAAGVIDVVAVDGKRHAVPTGSVLGRQVERAYHELYCGFAARLDQPIAEREVFDFMERRDADRSLPLFGYDRRDRQRFLRILSQSQLIGWRDEKVTLCRSDWGEAGAALTG
jgi:hypothetical protein